MEAELSVGEEIPQAKPGVTAHERLWAQMDTLQQDMDRARSAHQAQLGSGTAHAEALDHLHKLQVDFAQKILDQDEHLGIDHYKELWNLGDPDVLRARLFEDPHFPALDENVAQSSAAISELANAMSKINRNSAIADSVKEEALSS